MKLVEKLNAAQQVAANLTSPTVSVLSNNDRHSVCKTGHITTALMCSIITVKTLTTLPRTVQTKSLHQEHHITTTCYAPNHIMTTAIGTDPNPLTTETASEDALGQSRSHCQSLHGRSSSAYQINTSHSPSNHHSSLCYPSTD